MPDAMHSASGFERIEVVTGVPIGAGVWGEKLKAVEESRLAGMSVSYVARRQSGYPALQFALVFGWFREFLLERASGACGFRFCKRYSFISCFTPVRSPESNGMAEAFVKTFKQDYVHVHDRPDAKTVMTQLGQWFEDYNEFHPHKGLKMKSPRQFIRSQLLTASCPV